VVHKLAVMTVVGAVLVSGNWIDFAVVAKKMALFMLN
jgi:hypothetical protein